MFGISRTSWATNPIPLGALSGRLSTILIRTLLPFRKFPLLCALSLAVLSYSMPHKHWCWLLRPQHFRLHKIKIQFFYPIPLSHIFNKRSVSICKPSAFITTFIYCYSIAFYDLVKIIKFSNMEKWERKFLPFFTQYKNKFATMQKKFIVNLELLENGGDLLSHAKRWWQAVPAARLGLNRKKSLKQSLAQGSRENGGDLLSHGCAVPSARLCLTSLFGMGRGGTTVL